MLSHYANKNILVTGHTGFKGIWLSRILTLAGANVYGLSLDQDLKMGSGTLQEFEFAGSEIIDVRDLQKIRKYVSKNSFDGVFHLAAQSLVRKSYSEPLFTFETNVLGTANLLQSLIEFDAAKWVLVATTDKVYKNGESLHAYTESDALGGSDPYSASKVATEMVVSAWQSISKLAKNIPIFSVRSGNVIGGGDRAEDRLLPDLIRSFELNQKIILRNPNAVRPWQHVLEPLFGYLKLGEAIPKLGTSGCYNFGPNQSSVLSVQEMVEIACKGWPNSQGFELGDQSGNVLPESNLLLLDSSKAEADLGWKTHLSAQEAIDWTLRWEMRAPTMGTFKSMDLDIEL
jgi:CDP-glucose 4,6-dehydratase